VHGSRASLVGNLCLTSAGVFYSEGMQEYWGLNSFQYPQTAADEHEDSHAPALEMNRKEVDYMSLSLVTASEKSGLGNKLMI